MKYLLVVAFFLLTTPAFAQSAADQVFILSAANINTGAKTFYSHGRFSNLTGHELLISAVFIPAGKADDDPIYPLSGRVISFRIPAHRIGFEPPEFMEKLTAQGTGMIVFNGYRADVVPWLPHDQFSNDPEESFTVESTVTTTINGETRTHLQTVNGIPWYACASSERPGFERLQIDGVREDGANGAYHFTVVVANASQYSRTTVRIVLFDRYGVQQGWVPVPLGPLLSASVKVEAYFPVFNVNRANRLPPLDSPYLVIEQADTVKVAEGCPSGGACPAFLAMGVLTDTRSNDATSVPAHWLTANQSGQRVQQQNVAAVTVRGMALKVASVPKENCADIVWRIIRYEIPPPTQAEVAASYEQCANDRKRRN